MFSVPRRSLRVFTLIALAIGLARTETVSANPPGYPPAGAVTGACCAPGCNSCCAPCPPPDVCTCTTYKPVVDTRYHTQPIVGYHNVCRTCYKKEPYTVTIPVTKVDCVTVDEGCYKMVWCPRPVTKQIPRVEYHQQVCCRTVPYTVTQQVPHTMMQIIPEYRVHYCPETHTFTKPPCQPCGSCGMPGGCGMASATSPSGQAQQVMAASQPLPSAPTMENGAVLSPVPQPNGSAVPAAAVQQDGSTINNPYARARAAADVWQTNRVPVTQ